MLVLAAAIACIPSLTPSSAVDLAGQGGIRYRTTASGTRTWINESAGTQLDLGSGPEVELETGERPDQATKISLIADPAREFRATKQEADIFMRSSDGSLSVKIKLAMDSTWPILHKTVEVTNTSPKGVRLLNVVLARFAAGAAKVEGGERGFPLYLNQEFFLSLTHPAGFAHLEGRDVVLRQYPGVRIAPGKTFQSMEAIYGVAGHGQAQKLFVDYVRSRMYRVTHGHNKAYAILEAFGGQPDGNFKIDFSTGISESYVLKHLDQVADSERENHVQFDFYSLEFWHDRAGTLKEFDPHNFPLGFDRARDKILGLEMKPGLWIDSGGLPQWSIDQNPIARPSYSVHDGEGSFCRASEPIAQIYKDAFLYQMRVNKVGLLKFDNLNTVCVNPAHDHLPGPLYSTEAIYNGVIDFLDTLHEANPDVFLMLYWHYKSPWWLLHGDTYFETNDHIEAASPAQFPAPYARDSVTQRLDQAQQTITDTPWLGKDSLGVWLSDWAWNSGIGSTRWQEAVVMDMARGSLLLQIWTDANWLDPPQREQVATFIKLLKGNPDCFSNTRFFLGDPDKAGPYGYACSNGKHAFLSIDNACLRDSVVNIDLGKSIGLAAGGQFDVYRWYPKPAKLTFAGRFSARMRPYEVDLLEVVPRGGKPSLPRNFHSARPDDAFDEKTTELPVSTRLESDQPGHATEWKSLIPRSALSTRGAKLTVLGDRSIRSSGENQAFEDYIVTGNTGAASGLLLEALADDSLPGHGPGRAVNGNFALTNLRVQVMVNGRPVDVKVASAEADFSQTSFNGWPVGAAIDSDPKSGWSIHPEVGQAHAAVFRFEHSAPAGELKVTLTNGENGHSLGRFRLSVTSDPTPTLPRSYQPGRLTLSTLIPGTRTGGIILLVGGTPSDSPHGIIGSVPLSLSSVWSANSSWPCPWTAWRGEISPSDTARRLEVAIDRRHTIAGTPFKAYFLPK